MNEPSPLIKEWMIGALKRCGNTIIGEEKMRRHGIQTYIDAFASHGFAVTIRKGESLDGCRLMPSKSGAYIYEAKVAHYIVELKRGENHDQ